ncbi:hypothetical protein B0H14DRAFT_2588071 [Mycena olivaceomarginata]|nr:hypothetical protein B0H14DRAFT_2588071 [Mycena olivaceomarginata]
MSTFPPEVIPEIIDDLDKLVRTWAFAAVRAETFLYGDGGRRSAYLIMIALYVRVLRKRRLGQNRLLASATMVLFVLCTAHCVLVLAVIAMRSTFELGLIRHRDLGGGLRFLERKQRVVQTLGGLSLAANVVYVTATGTHLDARALSSASLRSPDGQHISHRMRYDSGIRPPGTCGGIAFLVLGLVGLFTVDVTTDGIVLAQLVGIAPTIIAVRFALGQSVENVNSFVVPRPRMHSPFHHETAITAMDSADNEVLYIRPESVKVEAV